MLVQPKQYNWNHCFESKLCPYGQNLIPYGQRRMNETCSFFCKINVVVQKQENIDFQIFVIYLNGMTLITLLIQILVTKMISSRKLGGKKLFASNCGQIWAYKDRFTAQKVILSANMLVQAQALPQKPNERYISDQQLRLIKILKFWKGLRFLRCGWFAILKYVKTPKTFKNVNFFL